MQKEIEKYSISKLYLNEFKFFNGEYNITFNIIDINTDKMVITVAVTNRGKISIIEYDLRLDKDNQLYFYYGCEYDKIKIDNFKHIED